MPGQTLWLAAVRGHHVHVEIAGIFTAEGDPFSVWREMRVRSLALKAGDATGHSARARHYPDVLCVSESDLSCADRRRAQQPRAFVLCVGFNEDMRATKSNGQYASQKQSG